MMGRKETNWSSLVLHATLLFVGAAQLQGVQGAPGFGAGGLRRAFSSTSTHHTNTTTTHTSTSVKPPTSSYVPPPITTSYPPPPPPKTSSTKPVAVSSSKPAAKSSPPPASTSVKPSTQAPITVVSSRAPVTTTTAHGTGPVTTSKPGVTTSTSFKPNGTTTSLHPTTTRTTSKESLFFSSYSAPKPTTSVAGDYYGSGAQSPGMGSSHNSGSGGYPGSQPGWQTLPPVNANVTKYVTGYNYTLSDSWNHTNFFDQFNFVSTGDPTNGQVNYLGAADANRTGLAYVRGNQTVLAVDDYSDLAYGAQRNSVRLESIQAFNGGLFVLDAAQMPTGCSVWGAYWMYGPDWPNDGEVDILENVNMASYNQYSAHTAPGCAITQLPFVSDFAVSGTQAWVVNPECGDTSGANQGCNFLDRNASTYGAAANTAGGPLVATLWDATGIRIWNFPRSSIPADLAHNSTSPQPEQWDNSYLKASWSLPGCDTSRFFKSMSVVLNIDLCGDWAGNSYAGSGCPGTCASQIQKGSNFAAAKWVINSIKIFT